MIAIGPISPVVRLALSRLEAWGLLVNHIDAALAANNFAAGVLCLDRCLDFHFFFRVPTHFSECSGAVSNSCLLLEPICDPAARQVVGRKLDQDLVAGQDPDEVLADFS